MTRLFIVLLLFLQLTACSQATDNAVSVNPLAFYGFDSTIARALQHNLAIFLADVKDNLYNSDVIDKSYIEQDPDAFVFLNTLNNPDENQPVIMRAEKLDSTDFLLKLGFTRTDSHNHTIIAGIYQVLVQQQQQRFTFYSPAVYNARYMQTYTTETITYKYDDSINTSNCETMNVLNQKIAALFKLPVQTVTYYKFSNPVKLFNYLGFDYLPNMYFDTTGGFVKHHAGEILAANNSEIYEHEFVHLYTKSLNQGQINHYANEGIATLIGGSGGIGYQQGLQMLAKYVSQKKLSNLYEGFINDFQVDGKISAKYFLGALICKKIEEKHGMEALKKLLTVPNTLEAFFNETNTLIGLNAENFNTTIAIWLQQTV